MTMTFTGPQVAKKYPVQLSRIVYESTAIFLKFQSKLAKTMQQILRLLQLNLFEKRDVRALLREDPPSGRVADPNLSSILL